MKATSDIFVPALSEKKNNKRTIAFGHYPVVRTQQEQFSRDSWTLAVSDRCLQATAVLAYYEDVSADLSVIESSTVGGGEN